MGYASKLVIVINLLTTLIGVMLLGVGLWAVFDGRFTETLCPKDTKNPTVNEICKYVNLIKIAAGIIAGVGGFITFVSIVAMIGACKGLSWVLGIYIAILVLMLGGVIAGTVFAFIRRADVETTLHGLLDDVFTDDIKTWKNETSKMLLLGVVQTTFKCCGVNGSESYGDYTPKVPECQNEATKSTGCVGKLMDLIRSNYLLLAAVAGGIGVLLLIFIIVGVMACRHLVNESSSY